MDDSTRVLHGARNIAANNVEVRTGDRVMVVSNLLLSRETTEESLRAVGLLGRQLDEWVGGGILLIAGALFDTACSSPGSAPGKLRSQYQPSHPEAVGDLRRVDDGAQQNNVEMPAIALRAGGVVAKGDIRAEAELDAIESHSDFFERLSRFAAGYQRRVIILRDMIEDSGLTGGGATPGGQANGATPGVAGRQERAGGHESYEGGPVAERLRSMGLEVMPVADLIFHTANT